MCTSREGGSPTQVCYNLIFVWLSRCFRNFYGEQNAVLIRELFISHYISRHEVGLDSRLLFGGVALPLRVETHITDVYFTKLRLFKYDYSQKWGLNFHINWGCDFVCTSMAESDIKKSLTLSQYLQTAVWSVNRQTNVRHTRSSEFCHRMSLPSRIKGEVKQAVK